MSGPGWAYAGPMLGARTACAFRPWHYGPNAHTVFRSLFQFPYRMGGLKATTKLVFIGHFVVRPPCKKVQGPLQLWQTIAFCRENTGAIQGPWMKIEINFKKGISKARHFVVKLPGPTEDSFKLEPLHFVVNPLGFWKTCNMFVMLLKYSTRNSIFEISTGPAQVSPDLPGFCFSL